MSDCTESLLLDEPAMEGLGMTPHLQTGELLIITTVLLLWAGQSGCVCVCMCFIRTCGCINVST